MVTQPEVDALKDIVDVLKHENADLMKRLDRAETAIERLQERLVAVEYPLRPAQNQRIFPVHEERS